MFKIDGIANLTQRVYQGIALDRSAAK